VTTVRLDRTKKCYVPYGKSLSRTPQVQLHSATAQLLRTQGDIEDTKNKCAEQLAPFFAIYNKIRAEPPKKPVILIPEVPVGLVPDSGILNVYGVEFDVNQIGQLVTSSHPYGLNVYGLEFDADQVRNLVGYLHFYCWEDWQGIDTNGLNSQEKQLAEILNETVRNEQAKIERLNGIADILDNVARRQKR
jgi:hypothetical protein